MSYEITLSEDSQYVICRVTRSMTSELAREITKELNRFCKETNIKRVLNDVRAAPNKLNVTENYEFAYKDMPQLEAQKDMRVAILASQGDHSHDFVETVSQNAGYSVRVFHVEDAAVAWLTD